MSTRAPASSIPAPESNSPAAVPEPRPRIVLAEDDAEVRRRLCALLASEYDVVAVFCNGIGIVEAVLELHPALILLDITLPEMSGIAVARLLRRRVPAVPVLFVTQHSEPAYVSEAFDAGGSGYVLKRKVVSELGRALAEVLAGGRYLSPGLRAA